MKIESNKFFTLSTSISERIGSSLTAQQKKITLIVAGALACLAACYILYWIFSKNVFNSTNTLPEKEKDKEKGNLPETKVLPEPVNDPLPGNTTQNQDPVSVPVNDPLPTNTTQTPEPVDEPVNEKKTADLPPINEPVGVEKVQTLHNGVKLEGHFIGDKLFKGKITYPDDYFPKNMVVVDEGEFTYNNFAFPSECPYRLHGEGKSFIDGKLHKEGMFQKGELHGKGKIYTGEDSYQEGEFQKGLLHGKGTIIEPKQTYDGEDWGLDIEGEFREGQLINGTMKGINGSVWKGEFESGVLHGTGTFKHADGTIEQGIFAHGTLITPMAQS